MYLKSILKKSKMNFLSLWLREIFRFTNSWFLFAIFHYLIFYIMHWIFQITPLSFEIRDIVVLTFIVYWTYVRCERILCMNTVWICVNRTQKRQLRMILVCSKILSAIQTHKSVLLFFFSVVECKCVCVFHCIEMSFIASSITSS